MAVHALHRRGNEGVTGQLAACGRPCPAWGGGPVLSTTQSQLPGETETVNRTTDLAGSSYCASALQESLRGRQRRETDSVCQRSHEASRHPSFQRKAFVVPDAAPRRSPSPPR